MNLALLVYELRALGVKSLALELSDDACSPATATTEDRATLAPDDPAALAEVEPEFRGDPNQCAVEGCGEPNGGVLGGKQAKFCRKHAFGKLGIK